MDKMTSKQAAEYLGLSKSQVNRLVKKGILKAELINAPVPYYLVDQGSVEAYKKTPRHPGPPKGQGGRPKKTKQKR